VPDLVFSEMKFLLKDKDISEPTLQQGAARKKHKKGHVHTKEGEISAFFTSVQPPQAEKDRELSEDKVREGNVTIAKTVRREREQSQKSSGVVPTIEKPNSGAYLGFGSRGARHESTGYMSWSESVRAPDMTPHRLHHSLTINRDHDEPSTHPPINCTTSGAESIGSQRRTHHSTNLQGMDTNAEHLVASLTAPAQHTLSRSQSDSRHTSPPRKVNLVDRATKSRLARSVTSTSSMTPYVQDHASIEAQDPETKVSAKGNDSEEVSCRKEMNTSIRNDSSVQNEDEQTSPEQQSSSDLGRILQHCDQTFLAQRRANAPCQRSHMSGRTDESAATDIQAHLSPSLERRRRPTVRFSGIDMLSPIIPTMPGRGLYQQQAQRHQVLLPVVRDEEDFPGEIALADQELLYQPDDMLYMEQEWEEQGDPLYYEEGGEDMEENCLDFGEDDFVQRLPSDNSVVAPGFWRPNRLY
jgi:hypothetical protein